MIRLDKDPTLGALLRQSALAGAGYYTGKLDNWWGPRSEAAEQNWKAQFLTGDGTWKWAARVDGADIVIDDASMTWFGGDSDPLDNGQTASGVLTKGNPEIVGVALPVVPGHPSTAGSPLAFGHGLQPGIPWGTPVQITRQFPDGTGYAQQMAKLIDNGPAKSAEDPIDATVKLFEKLGGNLREGVIRGLTVRIVGAAQYARG